MGSVIEIGMGELGVERAPNAYSTSGVGSCVVVCLYSSFEKVGAMAHIMLPTTHIVPNYNDKSQYRYANVAIAVMLQQLEAMQIRKSSLVAKIAGGANMFPDVQGRSQKVGDKNVESVREILAEEKITIAGEHVGGTTGRTVYFEIGNGIVTIKSNI